MNLQVIVHSEAEAEILEALTWYEERSSLAARAFVQELSYVVRLAARAPNSWPGSFGAARRIVFPRFPFDLIFRTRGKTFEIVAVAHHRRRPFYWKNR